MGLDYRVRCCPDGLVTDRRRRIRVLDCTIRDGSIFRNIKGIGGSTILGSGEVALILDVQALVQRCAKSEEQRATSASPPRTVPAPARN